MNPTATRSAIELIWAVTVLYWIVTAFRTKAVKTRVPGAGGYRWIFVIAAIFVAWAARRFSAPLFHQSPTTNLLGVLLCVAGICFAFWARLSLGRNWSGFVVIKQDHELIRRGPYRFVRHPLYSGLVLATFGSVIALSPSVHGFVYATLVTLLLYFKSRVEERFMVQEFGDKYAAFRREVPWAVVPMVF